MNVYESILSWYDAKKTNERKIAVFLIFASFIFLLITALFSKSSYTGMGGDNMMHFQYAHFSWKYPELLLDHTAKPLFTLLCSTFAQFGFFGAQLFNILAGLTSAWLSYLVLRKLGYENAWLVILFVVCAPLYFMMQMTSLTEILFSMLLMLAIYLFLSDKFILSALVLSFLPFARTEAIVIIPFFGMAYILNRKWLALPVLLTGFLIYSFIGMNYHHDFLWYIHQNAPPDARALYGSGNLLHFVDNTKYIMGLPIGFLFVAGAAFLLIKLFNSSMVERRKALTILWLIFFPFITFFALHSILWWKGLSGSAGLIRIIASVIPPCCIVSFIGYSSLSDWLSKYRLISVMFLLLTSFIIIRTNFEINNIPLDADPADKVVKEACDWVKMENKTHRLAYYYDPQVSFYLNLDPWDASTNRSVIWDARVSPELYADDGLVVWDSHFGPNEGKMPLDSLLNKKYLELVAVFKPDQPIIIAGYDFEVCVFRKLAAGKDNADNYMILDRLNGLDPSENNVYSLLNSGFESDSLIKLSQNITSELSHSGKYAYKLSSADQYSPGVSKLISSFSQSLTYPLHIKASVWILLKKKTDVNQATLVLSVEENGKSKLYNTVDLGTKIKEGKWTKLSTYQTISDRLSPSDIIKVYLWHHGSEELFLDDLTADLITKK